MNEKVKVLIPETKLQERLDELANQIQEEFKGETITLLCVLKGSVIFMVDLARKLNQMVEFDFMDISSYGNTMESSGIIKINKDLDHAITGKYVLLVEDIIDSGRTLSHLMKHLQDQKPHTLKICTLLDKPERRVVNDVTPDYIGFVIPDEFVVGYGLDYAQRYRNLPYVGVLSFEGE